MTEIKQIAFPRESRLLNLYDDAQLQDAFAAPLPADTDSNPEVLARFLMANQAPWVTALMAIRDAIASLFGLKTAKYLLSADAQTSSQQIHYFPVLESYPDEIVLGVNDRHLDFRLSLLCRNPDALNHRRTVVLCTVVHCHNCLGRIYLTIIAAFHRAVVRSGLKRACRAGWPANAITESTHQRT
jgi:hypothetical protein